MSEQSELFPPRKVNQAHPIEAVNEVLDTMAAVGWDMRSAMNNQVDVGADFRRLRACLEVLQSINAENMLVPGGPQEGYHEVLEMAYTAMGRIETEVDALREELEHQHQRLDEARDAAQAKATMQNDVNPQ
jgi:vacuolar-type H+-ATPase subunit I/STV1